MVVSILKLLKEEQECVRIIRNYEEWNETHAHDKAIQRCKEELDNIQKEIALYFLYIKNLGEELVNEAGENI